MIFSANVEIIHDRRTAKIKIFVWEGYCGNKVKKPEKLT
jgi:hypothetical protein